MLINYLYLALSTIAMSISGVLCGFYTRRANGAKDPMPLFSLVEFCAIFLFWIVMFLISPEFNLGVLLYSLALAVFLAISKIGYVFAIREGSLVLTSLIFQSSLILVSIWGMFFWGAKFTISVAIGLVMVAVSLTLCLYKGKGFEENKKKFSFKWLFYSLLAFLGNAGCTIVQKTQQNVYNGRYGNCLMLFASFLSLFVVLVLYLKSNKRDSKILLKKNFYLPISSGISNGLLNLFVMLLAVSALSPTLIYPTIGVGGLILTALISLFCFKEKLKWWQWVGVVVGIGATAILS